MIILFLSLPFHWQWNWGLALGNSPKVTKLVSGKTRIQHGWSALECVLLTINSYHLARGQSLVLHKKQQCQNQAEWGFNLALWPWMWYLTFPGLTFLICKVEFITGLFWGLNEIIYLAILFSFLHSQAFLPSFPTVSSIPVKLSHFFTFTFQSQWRKTKLSRSWCAFLMEQKQETNY